jgi:hypothetical protein
MCHGNKMEKKMNNKIMKILAMGIAFVLVNNCNALLEKCTTVKRQPLFTKCERPVLYGEDGKPVSNSWVSDQLHIAIHGVAPEKKIVEKEGLFDNCEYGKSIYPTKNSNRVIRPNPISPSSVLEKDTNSISSGSPSVSSSVSPFRYTQVTEMKKSQPIMYKTIKNKKCENSKVFQSYGHEGEDLWDDSCVITKSFFLWGNKH